MNDMFDLTLQRATPLILVPTMIKEWYTCVVVAVELLLGFLFTFKKNYDKRMSMKLNINMCGVTSISFVFVQLNYISYLQWVSFLHNKILYLNYISYLPICSFITFLAPPPLSPYYFPLSFLVSTSFSLLLLLLLLNFSSQKQVLILVNLWF